VQGSTSAPHITGQLIASNFQLNGTAWKALRTNVEADPSLVSLQHGDLEPATRGHLTFGVSAGLTKWAFSSASPIRAQIDASQLNIADIEKLTGQHVPVTGTLAASIRLSGTEMTPAGSGSLSIASLVAYGQPVTSAKLTFSGTGDEAHAALVLQLPAGSVQVKASVRPAQKTFDARLTANGIELGKLQGLTTRNINATGELSLDATGQGSFDNPTFGGSLRIPQLVMQNQTMTDLKLQLNVADRVANATLSTSAVNTNVQAKARIELSGDYLADATLDTQAIPLQPLLAVYAPAQVGGISGQTEVHATLHGPLKDKSLIEAHIYLPILKVAYGSAIELAAAAPIQVDFKNGVVTLQPATIRGTDTDLQLQGSYPIAEAAGGAAPLSLMLMGTVNLQLAQLFDPDIRTSGELKFNINSNGAGGRSDSGVPFSGQINIVDAAFASADLPIGLQHGNGVLSLTRDRLNINSFQGTIGGGTFTAQGGVALQPSAHFDLGLAAYGIRMLYPQGMRESADANLRLTGTTDSALLVGSVNVSDISLTSAFDLNSFISQLSGGAAAPPTPGFSQKLQLNVAVHSTSGINLVSRALIVSGSANLQVRGTAASPVILGRVNLNDGDIILNGDRFVLEGGTIQFVNPSETQPVVNLSLKTTIQQYDLYLKFNGPVDHLRTNYMSNPALPSADIINLLAFGQTTEASAANPSTPADQAAESLVASQVSSQVTSRVSRIAGISQLSISPVLTSGTSQGPPGANITIRQRVTGNLFVTFSTNVASTQSQTIQGQYQLSPRVAISATRDPNGGFAVDALIKKTW
jgi:translocation and assembly module TamB